MLIVQNNVLHYDILIHVYHGPSYSHSVCTFFETRSQVVQTASAPTLPCSCVWLWTTDLALFPECWDYRRKPPCLAYVRDGNRVLCMLGKYFTKEATTSVPGLFIPYQSDVHFLTLIISRHPLIFLNRVLLCPRWSQTLLILILYI